MKKKFIIFDIVILFPIMGLLVFIFLFIQHWKSITLGVPSVSYYWLDPVSSFMVIISGIIWLWMLVDCIRRKFEDKSKVLWIIILILGYWVGAMIYYFMVKRRSLV